ncbi:beta-glucan synthesis-associated protein [Flagelloscypha sp. PMI_526]|nr:beta-glucan synthesis-associated protein [Flagelloscypha sp. PMI_526]
MSLPTSQPTYFPRGGNVSSTQLVSGPAARNTPPSPRTPPSPGLRRPHPQFLARKDSVLSSMSSSSLASSISDKYSLSIDPRSWGSNISPHMKEADDFLHNPDPRRDKRIDHGGTFLTGRGFQNLGCLLLLALVILGLFVGYPVTSWVLTPEFNSFGAFNIGGLNASGQVPSMAGNWALIDNDTPKKAYKKKGYYQKDKTYQLVFSDEFNVDGRSFYPGDDPYWEATDLHYWATGNLEWYDPQAVTTRDGALEITLQRKETHDLHFEGGMVQTWNKFCFTGGLVEAAVSLPGHNNVQGLWPAVWVMGNLGRAGYGASLDGMWPYSYDSCDVGTVANQSINGLPAEALVHGDPSAEHHLSYLPGQRLSRCTCEGEEHPGPVHADGTYVGRSAPEIDFFEAQVDLDTGGHVSLSAQWAPFNAKYQWFNTTNAVITDPLTSKLNNYKGGAFQQATSVVARTNQSCYELEGGYYAVYGIEYKPGFDDAYISWLNDGQIAWTFLGPGTAADTAVEIGPRPVTGEPLYLIANLGISKNFGNVDFDNLVFPTKMRIDYIRVYQEEDKINVGCDPTDYPTKAYIDRFMEAYTNPNLTTWEDDFKQVTPKNRLVDQC